MQSVGYRRATPNAQMEQAILAYPVKVVRTEGNESKALQPEKFECAPIKLGTYTSILPCLSKKCLMFGASPGMGDLNERLTIAASVGSPRSPAGLAQFMNHESRSS